jgi:Methyltransferase domain
MVSVLRNQQESKCSVSIWILILSNLLVFQIASKWNGSDLNYELLTVNTDSSSSDYSLAIPKGKAIALPSVRVAKEEFKSNEQYGGKGDKPHLGGFTDMDHHGVSPAVWKWMMTYIGVHSILDVGCGRGISTSWFYFHGADVLCVEGSHDAIENTVIPDTSRIVEHDFSRGPWWPEKTYDAVWCVEFLEHVRMNIVYSKSFSSYKMSHSCLLRSVVTFSTII